MNVLLAVAWRELRLRVALLPLAAGLGLLAISVPRLVLPADERSLLEGMLTGVLLACLVAVSAVLTGSAVLAGDLAEGRLGFFLSTPVSLWSLGLGRLAAALTLTVAGGLLVVAPYLAIHPAALPSLEWLLDGRGPLTILAVSLALVAGANAASVSLRARTGFAALDLAGLGLCLFSLRRIWGQLTGAFARPHDWVLIGAGLLLAAILVAAAGVQLAIGRSDLRRSHAAMSLTLWGLLLPTLALATYGASRSLAARPSDLERVSLARPAPRGRWLFVSGPASGPFAHRPAFLVDPASGGWVRLAGSVWPWSLVFSADGRHAAWTDYVAPSVRLCLADLGASVEQRCSVVAKSNVGIALSPAGSHALLAAPSSPPGSADVRLIAAATGRTVASGPFAGDALSMRARFYTEDGVRLLAEVNGAVRLRLGELARGQAPRETGQLETSLDRSLAWSSDGSRLLVVARDASGRRAAELHDGTTGGHLVTLALPGNADARAGAFLSDGRIALVAAASGTSDLELFHADGRLLSSHPLGALDSGEVVVGGEPAPGIVAIGVRASSGRTEHATTLLVDTTNGRLTRVAGLLPLASRSRDPQPCGPESQACRVFLSDTGLVIFDPATRAMTPLRLRP